MLNCCNKSIKFTKRSWEKSIPLWLAGYFESKGVPAYLFDGNYGPGKLDKFEEKYRKTKQYKIAVAILKEARKQINSAHADFSIRGEIDNPFNMTAVGMLEIKSLLGYQKSKFRTEKIFQDICMCLYYNLFLGETGKAFMLFLNVPYKNKKNWIKKITPYGRGDICPTASIMKR